MSALNRNTFVCSVFRAFCCHQLRINQLGAKRTQEFITLFRGVSALSPLVNRAWSAVPVISYLAIGSPNKPRNIIGRPCLEENSMRTFDAISKSSLAAAVAALAAIFLTGARAAESLQIEGGQIADTAPDASRSGALRASHMPLPL